MIETDIEVRKSTEVFYNGKEQTEALKKWLATVEFYLKFHDRRQHVMRDRMEDERKRITNFLNQ